MHVVALQAVTALTQSGAVLFIAGQNLVEFWAVATRPAENNGLGLSTADAIAEVAKHKAAFRLLPDTPDILSQWEALVERHNVQGQKAHDTRLVAVALAFKVGHLLTFNLKDFQRFVSEGIEIVDPANLLNPAVKP